MRGSTKLALVSLSLVCSVGCAFEGSGVRPVDAPPTLDIDAPVPPPDARSPDAQVPPDASNLCDGPVHLLISEVTMIEEFGAFIEVCNPNPCRVDLGNYYLTDSVRYGEIASGTSPSVLIEAREFVARFPSEELLEQGGVAVMTLDGVKFEETFPEEAENLDNLYVLQNRGSYGIQMADPNHREENLLAAADDSVILFEWDGSQSAVTDVDMMAFCSKEDLTDCKDLMEHVITTPFNGVQSHRRIAKEEGFEVEVGGDGVDGHDERSEDLTMTWDNELGGEYPDNATPGNPLDGVCAP